MPIEAGGMLIATTQVTGDDGAVRSFGMVDLGCGLRIIGLMDPNLPLGTEVVAWSEVNGVATFVSVTQAPPLSRHEAVTA